MENHPRYLEIVWGAHYAGLVYTACRSRLTRRELAYIVNDCGARVFITSTYKADQAAEIVADTPGGRAAADARRRRSTATIATRTRVAAQPAEPLDRPHRRHRHALLLGHHRAAEGRRRPPFAGRAAGHRRPPSRRSASCLFGFDDDSVYLSPAPLYHAAPLRFTMAMHQLGGTVVVMEHFDAEQCLALIERYRVTHTQCVPTMFVRMLKLPEDVRARYDVSSLQVVDPRRRAVPGRRSSSR